MMPTLRQIRYFIATANSGQVSQAAMDLNVSQSAITTALKTLEEMLDTQLFTRHAHGMVLTYEGNQFLQHALHIMAAVEEAMRIPSRSHEKVIGKIRLAVSYTVAGYFIPPYLVRFQRSFPHVEIQLLEAQREHIEEGLLSGEYDLAIMLTSNLINQEDIAYEVLVSSRRRLWLSTHHPLREKKQISLQDVSEVPYIMLTVDEASNTAQRYWNQTPYQPNVVFRTSSVEAVRSMVANGYGVSILSDMVYRPWSLEGRRVEVLSIDDTVPGMDVGLAWAKKREQDPAEKAFCEFMRLAVVAGLNS
ncbi:LysR family transcriptional regulator [Parasalinivibrio latis]|uniref:LysR family transcriptional regulator n=1 Tax=Parasalinivibrio latis TaxID=2952610 RepID=UPI0030E5CAB9